MTMLLCAPVYADQYRSEVRELDTPPPEQPKQDETKLLQQALDPYQKALVLRDLAAAAAGRKDYAEAAKLLEQALAQSGLSGPAADEMKRNLAQLYLATGNYQKVMPQLEAQVKAGNAPAETYIALGAAYADQKKFKDAIPLLQKGIAASKAPDKSWKRALISAMYQAGQTRDLLPQLEQFLKEDPTHAEDWERVIALNLKAGNKERAYAYLDLAARLGFLDSGEQKLQLVNLTAQLGAPFQAGSLLQTWMDKGELPKNNDNWRYLATLWVNAREQKLALPALEQAVTHTPSKDMYLQIGQIHMDREEYGPAAAALEQAIALGAKNGATYLTLGMARYQQADVDGALKAFTEAEGYKDQTKLATQWAQYLESGKAREQALAAVSLRRTRNDSAVALASGIGGSHIVLGADEGGASPSVTRAPLNGGDPLTPVGADRPGNVDNSIPAWTGGMLPSEKPAAYNGTKVVDPFPSDRPLYVVTAANMAQYKDKLSRGHLALLHKYPDYQMPVYVTRRTASYPQPIYDATQVNIGKAKLLGSDALSGAHLGFPFPHPQSGVEIMWNHRTRYRGDQVSATYSQAVVAPDGSIREPNKTTFKVWFRYGNVKDPIDLAQQNILLYGITYGAPAGHSPDYVALFHETANSIKQPRNIWVLIVKLQRMLRIPPVGYDQPFPASEGLMFIDMVDMYNGAFDRYVWKLQGKREMLIPYNDYRLSDGHLKNAQLLTPKHFNQKDARYELHRVWVIEATERGGMHHVFGKRTFYVDEDSWNVVLVENEDHDGNLWRFQEGHLVQLYDVQAMTALPDLTYDLKDGRYFANRLFAEDGLFRYDEKMTANEFLPEAVKNRYGH
ncbi:MAG TPA: DUF1329 domain-containing protein [Nevskiaceae bacterium]|nr:DUF1329 domain-containing protein [Nevskiaceae bacterium]